MNGPWRVPSARAQNHVGSGAGASASTVFGSHPRRGGGDASTGAASTGTWATTVRGGSAGALFGPLGPEPQPAPIVKTKTSVGRLLTLILLHDHIGISEPALPSTA